MTNSFGISFWQADEVTEENSTGQEIVISVANRGVAFNFNWLFAESFQFVLASGFSDGGERGLAKNYVVVAHSYMMDNGDALSSGINFYDSVSKERAQTTFEIYYRYRASRFTSVTPVVQWIHSPSLNENVDNILYAAFRLRMSF